MSRDLKQLRKSRPPADPPRCEVTIYGCPPQVCGKRAKELINGRWMCGMHALWTHRRDKARLEGVWRELRDDEEWWQRVLLRRWLVQAAKPELRKLIERGLSPLNLNGLLAVRELIEAWERWRRR